MEIGTENLCGQAGKSSGALLQTMLNHPLACKDGRDYVICRACIVDSIKSQAYAQTFTTDNEIP